MADEILKSDPNRVRTIGGVTDDSSQEVRNIRVDPATSAIKIDDDQSQVILGNILQSLASDLKTYDTTAITYVSGGAADGEIETVTYLNGVTPLYTLTMSYNAVSGKLESVVRS